MSRHEVVNSKGMWKFGWDQPLRSFWLQLHHEDLSEEENPVIWLGGTGDSRMYEVEELVQAARRNGLEIDISKQKELFLDKDEGR
jgi:hypothetical protein